MILGRALLRYGIVGSVEREERERERERERGPGSMVTA
jgi:hypothetical protein